MRLATRIAAPGALVALLAVPALALAAQPRAGTFTSTKADIHVAKGGMRMRNAQINCKQGSGGLTLQSINFPAVKIKSSGAFTYHGPATYVSFTGSGYKSRMATASLRGTFDSSTAVHGTVSGGPSSCRSVKFTATYNPRAH